MEQARTSLSFERTGEMSGPDRWEQRYAKLETNPNAQNDGFQAFSKGVAQYQNPADTGNGMAQDAQKRLNERNNLAASCFGGDPVICRAQASLVQAGYDLGKYGYKGVDGEKGPLTTKAIAEFQKANHLEPTGMPDRETMRMLDLVSEKGLKKKDIETLDSKVARETDSIRQAPQQVILGNEMSPEAQQRLAERDALALKASIGNPYIAKSQASLQMAGYDLGKGGIDGIEGSSTSKAVMEYQKDKALKPTGKLDVETMISLNNSTADGWKGPEHLKNPEKQDGSLSHTDQKSLSNPTLEKNNPLHYIVAYDDHAAFNRAAGTPSIPKNSVLYDQVKESQKQLQQMGFDIGSDGVDGKIGKHTAQAIKDFQVAVHLPVTGELDKVTAARMESGYKKGMVAQRGDEGRNQAEKQNKQSVLSHQNPKFEIKNVPKGLEKEFQVSWEISDKEFENKNALSLEEITKIMNKNNPELVKRGFNERLYELSQKYDLNPKILLATLAQEQSWCKLGNYNQAFGVGAEGHPKSLEGGGMEIAAKTYRYWFDKGKKEFMVNGHFKEIHTNYDTLTFNGTSAIKGHQTQQWLTDHPQYKELLQNGVNVVPVNAAMYAKMHYTPWIYFPPQGSHPLQAWNNYFESFK